MPRSRRLGAHAEDAAAEFLRGLGYTIVTRNYVAPGLSEIDIVAMDGELMVFVEVKERRANSLVGPEESVSLPKQRRLWAAANYYLGDVVGKEVDARFDVVAFDGGDIRHHIDAFRPGH
ncbi:MAG: YraN family protein [Fimbriimonadales bacterium]